MRVVHMHHIDPGGWSDQVAAFLRRDHAVCATPKACPGRYARDYRVGLLLEARPVRYRGKPVTFAVTEVDRSTLGDSWLWPGSVTSMDIEGFTQPNEDGVEEDYSRHVSTDWSDGWPLETVVEVWVIPMNARLCGFTLDASVYAHHRDEVDAVAAAYGVPVHVVPDPPHGRTLYTLRRSKKLA